MEASGAGLATGAGDAGGEGGEVESKLDPGAASGQPAPAAESVQSSEQLTQYLDSFKTDMFDEMGERFGHLEQQTQQEPLQQQPQAEPAQETPEPGQFDTSLLDPSSPYYDPGRAAEAMLGAVRDHAEQTIKRQIAPLQAQQVALQRNIATQELLGRHPDLANDEVAGQVLASSEKWAQEIATDLGQPELADQIARSPKVWEAMFLRDRASTDAVNEGKNEGPPVATLEGGGGPGPSASTQSAGQQLSERLLAAGPRNPLQWG